MGSPTGRIVPLEKGAAVLLDELGSKAILTVPVEESGVLLDLGGRLNKTDERWSGRFVMSVGQAAELIGAIVVAGKAAGESFAAELAREIDREQARIRQEWEEQHG